MAFGLGQIFFYLFRILFSLSIQYVCFMREAPNERIYDLIKRFHILVTFSPRFIRLQRHLVGTSSDNAT